MIERLQAAVGESAPAFFGYPGALQRFLALFPAGFSDPAYIGDRRSGEAAYKRAAIERARSELPLNRWREVGAPGQTALRLFQATNLVDPYTKAKLADVLRSSDAVRFLSLSEALAHGDVSAACSGLVRFRDAGLCKWTALTYLPFLWRPDAHFYLKPVFTLEFARRVGHAFVYEYESTPNPATYAALLDLVSQTRKAVDDLKPQDNVDIHSFMWAAINYTERGDSED
ncbi:hypothetical protein [Wenxinia marina]|uniref:hypothetical protein n=1 Tax=Wenxinia marina TaxID=390641 RepID=UPI0012E00683|nr:hypothetical protein [Wenxinia marina]